MLLERTLESLEDMMAGDWQVMKLDGDLGKDEMFASSCVHNSSKDEEAPTTWRSSCTTTLEGLPHDAEPGHAQYRMGAMDQHGSELSGATSSTTVTSALRGAVWAAGSCE